MDYQRLSAELDEYLAERGTFPTETADAFGEVCRELERLAAESVTEAQAEEYRSKSARLRAYERAGGEQKARVHTFCADIIGGREEAAPVLKRFLGDNEPRKKQSRSKGTKPTLSFCYNFPKSARFDERELDQFIQENEAKTTFSDLVNEHMVQKGLTAPEVYKRAHLSRQDFSRITGRNCKGVKRATVFNVAIGLQLNVEETKKLLRSAGFAYNRRRFDVIVIFFIDKGIYDVDTINAALFDRDQQTLPDSYDPPANN